MTDEFRQLEDDALALGRANSVIMELARNHCQDMIFSKENSGGYVEALSGLPIDRRHVSCPVATSHTSGMNLDVLARDFYAKHCVGCSSRRPTGEVPNLASMIEADAAANSAAAERVRDALNRQHQAWESRVEQRRASRVGVDPVTASVLDDFGVLDMEPGCSVDPSGNDAAIRRLTVLAERRPDAFSNECIDLAILLIETDGVVALLAPLRRTAHARPELVPKVLAAAMTVLRRGADLEAGRCVNDLWSSDSKGLDVKAVSSLVFLAGAPDRERFGHFGDASSPRDIGGLRTAATHAPEIVTSVLRSMLPPPVVRTSLHLPPGALGRVGATSGDSEYERASAAFTIRALAQSHPLIADELVAPMVLNLAVPPVDRYDRYAIASVERALATLFLLGIGDVLTQLNTAGRGAAEGHRERLFNVLQAAGQLLDPNDRWRKTDDSQVDDPRRREALDQLTTFCLTRAGGDWGVRIGFEAAGLLKELAEIDPVSAYGKRQGLLGAFLTAVDRLDTPLAPTVLVADPGPRMLRAAEASAHRSMVNATARELLYAVANAAAVNPISIVDAVVDLIGNERDSERGVAAVRPLLRILARLGVDHGSQPGVLQHLLPTLHTYMVDVETALRAEAITSWGDIASQHPLPSSLSDLLDALLTDSKIVVIEAVLKAANRLPWPEPERARLLKYAIRLCALLDSAGSPDLLTQAMWTATFLAAGDERTDAVVEELILQRASELGPHELAGILQRTWSPQAGRSSAMAHLRLRQARDPQINDRYNNTDDKQWIALLDCGSGLAGLPTDELTTAAVEEDPRFPLASAMFAEVAWRAGRPSDAASIMQAVAARIPAQPAFDQQRAFAHLLTAAAEFDASDRDELDQRAGELAEAISLIDAAGVDVRTELIGQIKAGATVRLLFAGRSVPTELCAEAPPSKAGPQGSSSVHLRQRADHLAAAGARLDSSSRRATATGAYRRMVGALCEIAAHLQRLDAAELDADTASVQAHSTAARRRAHSLTVEIRARFDDSDPLAAPLLDALVAVDTTGGSEVASTLESFAKLIIPIMAIRGSERRRSRPAVDEEPSHESESETDVAVVLASINGNLITGPMVVQPSTAYALALKVQAGDWPEWADYLDAEILSHFSTDEAETPSLTWPRPVDGSQILTGEGTCIVRFGLSAGQPAPPFRVVLRWRGTRDGQSYTQMLDVAGHRELRFRPYDSSRDALTRFAPMDERLLSLYEGLHGAGYNEQHIQAFCRLFTAICRASLAMTWSKKYKLGAKVSERTFHNDLDAMLRNDPDLGGRVERGSPNALGFLDVRHDGITAELKVESKTPVTRERAPKYLGQPTQYAAADGARLSILCVLDMSRKTSPIGTPENYVFTLQPALHGMTNPEAPSLTAVIIVNGSNPTPSSWSRRRIALQPQPGSGAP